MPRRAKNSHEVLRTARKCQEKPGRANDSQKVAKKGKKGLKAKKAPKKQPWCAKNP